MDDERATTGLDADYELRPLGIDDADALAEALVRNREHLAPWDPDRAEAFFTPDGQRESITAQLALIEQGRVCGWVLWDVAGPGPERVVGRITLTGITRGIAMSGVLGYWVDHEVQGRGLASMMVRFVADRAIYLGLHRLEAGTMLENAASQAVLRRCGFAQYGTAERYLWLNGAWRDHHLFQLVLHDEPGGSAYL